jgi:hypothetical protein
MEEKRQGYIFFLSDKTLPTSHDKLCDKPHQSVLFKFTILNLIPQFFFEKGKAPAFASNDAYDPLLSY